MGVPVIIHVHGIFSILKPSNYCGNYHFIWEGSHILTSMKQKWMVSTVSSPLNITPLVNNGWWFGCHEFWIFPLILGIYVIIPTDEVLFFRGVALAHQPVNSGFPISLQWHPLRGSTSRSGAEELCAACPRSWELAAWFGGSSHLVAMVNNHTGWCPSSWTLTWFISPVTMVYRWYYRTSYWDYNPFITGGGHHLVLITHL